VLRIDRKIELFEAIASIQLCQAIGETLEMNVTDDELYRLFILADVLAPVGLGGTMLDEQVLNFDLAYRAVDQSKGEQSYTQVLAKASGVRVPVQDELAKFSFPQPTEKTEEEYIVLLPFPVKRELGLPYAVWAATTRLLRSYGIPIYVVGEQGQRIDGLGFREDEMMMELDLDDKIKLVARAKLLVGVPSSWGWIGAGFGKDQIVMVPEELPIRRWFGFPAALLVYKQNEIQVPVLMTMLRQLLKRVEDR
jgi:ADP-heptose:LPS heptosyltransferase